MASSAREEHPVALMTHVARRIGPFALVVDLDDEVVVEDADDVIDRCVGVRIEVVLSGVDEILFVVDVADDEEVPSGRDGVGDRRE